jgi:O-antigen/teichoic acid export membrane protein
MPLKDLDDKLMNSEILTVEQIKKRVISSFFSLSVRQVFLRAFSFITINIILASILPIETLGIFNIATAIITFFAYFSDVGLAGSLIQKREEVTQEDIKTVFSIQQLMVGVLAVIIIIFAPQIGKYYGFSFEGEWLIRILGISFFLSSLKVIPTVLLERELKFRPIVTVELVETLIFNILLIVCVYQGLGLWSFSIAALGRGVSGTLLIFLLAPVRVGIGIHKASAQQLLNFGIPFQANSFLALIKDRLVPLVVAGMVGTRGMSYITWSQNMAFIPLEVMNIIIRITFPAFSRLQQDKQALTRAIEKSLFVTAFLVYPALFGIAALVPSVIQLIVSEKFDPALTGFYLFAVNTFWAVISTTFTNALNAMGHIKTTLKLMVMWTILTWAITPLFVYWYGFVGVAIASALISFTSIIPVVLIKRVLPVNVLDAVLLPICASIAMFLVVFSFATYFVTSKLMLFPAIGLGILTYTLFVLLFGKQRILNDLKTIRSFK